MVVESGSHDDRVNATIGGAGVRDRVALESLVGTLYPWARSVAYVLCRNRHEADDLVQEALVQLVKRPPDPLNVDVVRAWLRTGMFRIYLRKSRRATREIMTLRALARQRSQPQPELSAETLTLLSAIGTLSARQRACVVLRYLEDLSEEDVARSLGVRHGTVKAHLAQARARLRDVLAEPVPAID